MMRNKNPVSDGKFIGYFNMSTNSNFFTIFLPSKKVPYLPNLNNFPSHLMPQHQWSLLDAIPFKDITPADAAGFHLDKNFAFSNRWFWELFYPDVVIVVIDCCFH